MTMPRFSLKQLVLVLLFLGLALFVALNMHPVQSTAIAYKAGSPLLAITHPEPTAITNWFMRDIFMRGVKPKLGDGRWRYDRSSYR